MRRGVQLFILVERRFRARSRAALESRSFDSPTRNARHFRKRHDNETRPLLRRARRRFDFIDWSPDEFIDLERRRRRTGRTPRRVYATISRRLHENVPSELLRLVGRDDDRLRRSVREVRRSVARYVDLSRRRREVRRVEEAPRRRRRRDADGKARRLRRRAFVRRIATSAGADEGNRRAFVRNRANFPNAPRRLPRRGTHQQRTPRSVGKRNGFPKTLRNVGRAQASRRSRRAEDGRVGETPQQGRPSARLQELLGNDRLLPRLRTGATDRDLRRTRPLDGAVFRVDESETRRRTEGKIRRRQNPPLALRQPVLPTSAGFESDRRERLLRRQN